MGTNIIDEEYLHISRLTDQNKCVMAKCCSFNKEARLPLPHLMLNQSYLGNKKIIISIEKLSSRSDMNLEFIRNRIKFVRDKKVLKQIHGHDLRKALNLYSIKLLTEKDSLSDQKWQSK